MKHLFSFAILTAFLLSATGVFAQDDVTWELVSTLPAGYVIGMEQHPGLGSVALSIGGKISHSVDSGKTWKHLNSTISQASGMTVDAIDPSVLYAATRSGVHASADGKDWDPVGLLEDNIRAIDIARGQNVIMVLTLRGIFFSSDRGVTWDERNDAIPKDVIHCIGAARSNYTFAGTREGLYMHEEIDFDWQETSIKSEDVTALRINGSVGDAWAGTVNAVYYCDNFESGWTHKLTTPAEITFIWNPAPAVLAGATNNLFYSSNNGESWKPAITGIKTPDVTSMMTSEDHHVLLATKDGSIYRSKEVVGSTLSVEGKSDKITSGLSPNPARHRTVLSMSSKQRVESISIMDMTGREVRRLSVTPGSTTLEISTQDLLNGAYMLLLHSQEGVATERMIVQH